MQKALEKAYEARKATEEQVSDGVIALGRAEGGTKTRKIKACYQRAKGGVRASAGGGQCQGLWSGFPSYQGGARREDCGV